MPTMTCEHDDTTLTQAALQLLPESQRARLAEQLETCAACRLRFAEYQRLVSDLHSLVPAGVYGGAQMDRETDGSAAPTVTMSDRWRHGVEPDADGRDDGDGCNGHERRVSLPRPVRARPALTLVGTLAALLLLALLLSSFWAFGPGRGPTSTRTHPAGTKPGLPVVDRVLGAAPLACAGAPAPQANVDGIGGAIGAAPFWVGGFVGTHATLLSGGGTAVSPYGWYGKIVTQMDGAFPGTLTLRGMNLRNNTPLWFQLGGATTTMPSFRQSAGASDVGYIFIPTAGCYTLTVNWGAGSWTYTFGAGTALPASVGALPATCPNQPQLAPLASGLPEVFGQLPLWLTAEGPRASYRLDLSGDGVPLTFFVANSLTTHVSIRGKSLENGSPVGFVAPPDPAATLLVLTNQYQRAEGPYTEWQGRAYFPAAGCYTMTATWPGGSWTFEVAAGA